jgi:hypothetical protein
VGSALRVYGRPEWVSDVSVSKVITGEKDRPLQPQLPYRNLDDIVQKVSARFFGHAFDDIAWCFVIQLTLRGNHVAASTSARRNFVMATTGSSNPPGLRVDCLANIASMAW